MGDLLLVLLGVVGFFVAFLGLLALIVAADGADMRSSSTFHVHKPGATDGR